MLKIRKVMKKMSLLVNSLVLTVLCNTIVYANSNGINVEMGNDNSVTVTGTSNGGWKSIFDKFKNAGVGIAGICILVLAICLVICIVNLGTSASNPNKRSQALSWLVWLLICIGLLGAVGTIFGLAYGLFS